MATATLVAFGNLPMASRTYMVTNRLYVSPMHLDEFAEHYRTNAPIVGRAPGLCLSICAMPDHPDSQPFVHVMVWHDEASYYRWLRTNCGRLLEASVRATRVMQGALFWRGGESEVSRVTHYEVRP